jgi:tetratricopeptide (TPR) repeat protein
MFIVYLKKSYKKVMDNLEYIDAYFQNSLSDEEKKEFEKKCVEKKSFAEEVAFYVSARHLLKAELVKTKQQAWEQGEVIGETIVEEREPIRIERNRSRFRWLKYVAAACIVLAIATYIFERPVNPQQMAETYLEENYSMLPQKMGIEDKFSAAKEAYGNKDYATALAIFQAVLSEQPDNAEAVKYVGIVSLRMDKYDKALEAFDRLSRMDLRANSGLFLKAVTLLKRNEPGDKEQAKQILQTVVDQQAGESKVAKEWLEKF